jgi:excisionase family DNA binding protein
LPVLHCSLTSMSIDAGSMPELLTIAEVAELLKISVPSVRRLQQQRKVPFVRVGGSIRFFRSDIASYLEKRRVRSID